MSEQERKTSYWRNGLVLGLISIFLASCALLTYEPPVPTPLPISTVTPLPTPDETCISSPMGTHLELRAGVATLNHVIALCNSQPSLCQQDEMIIRLNAMSSAIENVFFYGIFLQSIPREMP